MIMPQRAGVPQPGLQLPGASGFTSRLAWQVQLQIIRCWERAATSINFHKHQFLLVFAHQMVTDRGTVQSNFPSQPVCSTPGSSVLLLCSVPPPSLGNLSSPASSVKSGVFATFGKLFVRVSGPRFDQKLLLCKQN